MHSPSLAFFYAKIEKHILLAQSYTEISNLSFIIKACRLKPYDIILNKNIELILHRLWVDEFGNSLHITNNKKILLTYNDLRLDRKKIACTDMYYGLSLQRVVKMSKLMYLCAGKDEDQYQDCYLLTLLGEDDHLRSYLYWYGEWQQVSPLLMGMKHLKLLASHIDIKYFQQLSGAENLPLPCVSGQAWLSFLPISKDFLDIINKQYEMLLPIFGDKYNG